LSRGMNQSNPVTVTTSSGGAGGSGSVLVYY
jgi:hypothetical protein